MGREEGRGGERGRSWKVGGERDNVLGVGKGGEGRVGRYVEKERRESGREEIRRAGEVESGPGGIMRWGR